MQSNFKFSDETTPSYNNKDSKTCGSFESKNKKLFMKFFPWNHIQIQTSGSENLFLNFDFLEKALQGRIIQDGKWTVVLLDDGSKGVAECSNDDEFSLTRGLSIALLRAMQKSIEKELERICS